jgi:hypothetical protein
MTQSRTKRFKSFISFKESEFVKESIEGEAKEIAQEIDTDEIEKIDPEKIAATLSALIDAGGDLDKIDLDQIEENFQQILEDSEKEGGDINESETGIVYLLEVMGTVFGNVDLMHFISEKLSKKLGRKIDISKSAKLIESILNSIKKATGFAAKVFKKFFEWIGKLLGLDKVGTKLMGLISLGVATIIMIVVGIAFFPAASAISGISGVLALFLSVTALIGKITEVIVISQEIITVIRLELDKKLHTKDPTEEQIKNAILKMTLSI